jgi:hypothetical protein
MINRIGEKGILFNYFLSSSCFDFEIILVKN